VEFERRFELMVLTEFPHMFQGDRDWLAPLWERISRGDQPPGVKVTICAGKGIRQQP
jgi:hypothetical protein